MRTVLRCIAEHRAVWTRVLVLCLAAGFSAALLCIQLTRPYTAVSSVVTLDYDIRDASTGSTRHVRDLTAPDGTALNLSEITSSYVLQEALEGRQLSRPVSLASLRDQIRIERILTKDSRRQQELANAMLEDRSRAAYFEVKGIPLAYVNRFVVTLTNGFAEEGSGTVYELQEDELCRLLDRILDAYNDFLVRTYVDRKLPADAFSCIDTGNLDLMESLDQLQEAAAGLYSYCTGQPRNVRRYRSWRTGLTLNDLMRKLSRLRRHDLGYLSAWVFTNGIADDREGMLTNYRYELRNLESDREAVEENIRTDQQILTNYVNDQIYVTVQESDSLKAGRKNTDTYNRLYLQQAGNYARKANIGKAIEERKERIGWLEEAGAGGQEMRSGNQEYDVRYLRQELERTAVLLEEVYHEIQEQMEEILDAPVCTRYAEHIAPQVVSQ